MPPNLFRSVEHHDPPNIDYYNPCWYHYYNPDYHPCVHYNYRG